MLSIIMKSISTGPPAPMSIIDSPGTDVEDRREEAERERKKKNQLQNKRPTRPLELLRFNLKQRSID